MEGLFNIVGQGYIRVAGLRVINAGPGRTTRIWPIRRTTSSSKTTRLPHQRFGIGVWASSEVVWILRVEEACYAATTSHLGGWNRRVRGQL
jgi:hypothetical protein